MNFKLFFLPAALWAAGFLCGCAGHVILDTSNLQTDEGTDSSLTITDDDLLDLKIGKESIFGQILKPNRTYGEKRPCIILLHGFSGLIRFDDLGQALCRAGGVVVIPHFRGVAGSHGKFSFTGSVQDTIKLIRHVKSENFRKTYHIDPEAIFLISHGTSCVAALEAANTTGALRGVVLLDPCDIGAIVLKSSIPDVHAFLEENGLDSLNLNGFDTLYQDLVRNSLKYSFSTSFQQLKGIGFFLISACWDPTASTPMLNVYYSIAEKNKTLPVCQRKKYKTRHSFMGARIQIARDIAEFILKTMEAPGPAAEPDAPSMICCCGCIPSGGSAGKSAGTQAKPAAESNAKTQEKTDVKPAN